MNVNYNNAEFILSAFDKEQFIADQKPQIVFAGRSNVGKSSVINALCNRKSLARVGSAPGKTRSVNYFNIDNKLYFVDLPGYGYAKVSHTVKESWAELIEAYFSRFSLITLGVMIVDARHKPTELDVKMAGYFQQTCIPWMVLANKADKLKKKALAEQLEVIRATLVLDPSVPLIAFSGEDKTGRNQAISALSQQITL